MRLGVVSDVHNNVEALTYALDALRGCEVLLNLGDLVSQYRVTPEILRVSREAGLLGILGNHEKCILSPASAGMRSRLAPEDLAFLEELPDQRSLSIDGRQVKVVHGSPWDDPADIACTYVFGQDARFLARLATTKADVLLLGHTHVAMATRLGDMLVLNPGSCGEARDRARRLSFAELDFAVGAATVYEVRPGASPEAFIGPLSF
jgi:putative phosphoesterase